MSQIILDFGSGNTCNNNKAYIKKMYDELKKIDTGKHEVIVKWQLFKEAGQNIPLTHDCFDFAHQYGTSLGYKVTSSIFDKESLDFLLQYDIPFVKIANNRDLDWLIEEVPRNIPVYISCSSISEIKGIMLKNAMNTMCVLSCVSKYPADVAEYEEYFIYKHLILTDADVPCCEVHLKNISDHTINFDLWNKYNPRIIEWHYGLQDSTGLDAGLFMRTPEMLQEVL